MAEMDTSGGGGHKKGPGVKKSKKLSTRVDLTPMVDLGFLLITFFIFTTTMSQPTAMRLFLPKDTEEKDQNKVKASQAITILLGKENRLYYYFGAQENGVDPELVLTDYSSEGIRKMLVSRNAEVVNNVNQLKLDKAAKKISEEDYKTKLSEYKSAKSAPTIMIMATDDSNYKNLVDILDEMNICNIARYAIVDITPYDLGLIDKKTPPAK